MSAASDANIKSFIGDYSVTPETAIYQPAANEIALIFSMNISIEDTGAPDSGKYGNNIVLTNGITFKKTVDPTGSNRTVEDDLTNGSSVKTNGDYARYTRDVTPLTFGTGNTFVNVSHSFKDTSAPVLLHGSDNDRFEVGFSDSFVGLVSHTIYLSGVILADNKSTRSIVNREFLLPITDI